MSSDISSRIVQLLKKHQDGHGFFAKLESETGIKSTSWRAALHGRQKPTLEMLEAIVSRWPDEASWLFGLKENDIATDYRSVTLAAAHAYRYISQNKLRLSSSQFGNLVTQFFKLVKDSATLPADISETEKWIIADEILEMGGIPFLEEELEHEKKRAEDDNQIEAWGRKQR